MGDPQMVAIGVAFKEDFEPLLEHFEPTMVDG